LSLFNKIHQIRTSDALDVRLPQEYVLDLDIDYFAEYNHEVIDELLPRIKEIISHARFVTVASSPFFIEQSRGIDLIKKLFTN